MSTLSQVDTVRYALDNSGFQLGKAFDGIQPEHWTFKVTEASMSPAEMAEHLCECYTAFQKSMNGETHDWGNYSSGETTQAGLMSKLKTLRDEVVQQATTSDKPEAAQGAFDYVVLHDCYHVGQLALVRMATEPNWDPYSIYPQ